MNKLSEFTWKLLSTDKFDDVSTLAVKTPGPVAVRAAEDPKSLDVLKKFLTSETKIYIVNFLRFLGSSSRILS